MSSTDLRCARSSLRRDRVRAGGLRLRTFVRPKAVVLLATMLSLAATSTARAVQFEEWFRDPPADYSTAQRVGYRAGQTLGAPVVFALAAAVDVLKLLVTPLGSGQPSPLGLYVTAAETAAAMRPDPASAPLIAQNPWPAPVQRPGIPMGPAMQVPQSVPVPVAPVVAPPPLPRERSSNTGSFSVTGPNGNSNCQYIRYGNTYELVCN